MLLIRLFYGIATNLWGELMIKRNKNNTDTNSMYKENSTEYIKTEKTQTHTMPRKKMLT